MVQTRRDFLEHLTAAAVSLPGSSWIGQAVVSPTRGAPTIDSTGAWASRPMRWAQVAFVEDDPGNYDPTFWLNYFKTIHADAACLSAGGVVAFYPTEVPLHYRSRWLGSHDSFGELTEGCRRLGMNVMARTDPHACHQDMHDAHPEWIMCDELGAKRRHPPDPMLWLTCPFGGYNFTFMASAEFHYAASGEPYKSHDDEGTAAGGNPFSAADCSSARARGQSYRRRAAACVRRRTSLPLA